MMYGEFIEGTGCKDNTHNYEVFRNLEAMYMNTNMTKDQVYEYGKKLVDNSKSEEELKLEAQVRAEIASNKEQIEYYEQDIKRMREMIAFDKDWKSIYSGTISYERNEVRRLRAKNRVLKEWFLK